MFLFWLSSQSECWQEEGGAAAGGSSESRHLPSNYVSPVWVPPPAVVGWLGEGGVLAGQRLPIPAWACGQTGGSEPGQTSTKMTENIFMKNVNLLVLWVFHWLMMHLDANAEGKPPPHCVIWPAAADKSSCKRAWNGCVCEGHRAHT